MLVPRGVALGSGFSGFGLHGFGGLPFLVRGVENFCAALVSVGDAFACFLVSRSDALAGRFFVGADLRL